MADNLSKLITRHYANFRGVDFTGGIVSAFRSPDSLNMWKDYHYDDCIMTRPGMQLIGNFDYEIFGLFFYKINNNLKVLVHAGTKLYLWNNYPNTPVNKSLLFEGMNIRKSNYFVFDETLFIMDGINYLEYDGSTLKAVEGTVPMTSYWKNPDGSVNLDQDTDADYVYQHVNCLTGRRKNSFIGDGTSTDYKLDINGLDQNVSVIATVDGTIIVEGSGLTANRTDGIITFATAPAQDAKVIIDFSKTAPGYRDRILNCTMIAEFDNRIFFSGNPDYPNSVFHCELSDPRYVRDTAYYEIGLDIAPVKALIPGNNVLWVVKDTYQNQASVHYMTPTIDLSYGDDHKIYPSVSGNIAVGCVSTGLNFNDDIVFFSHNGLEGIASSALYSEQLLQHRSSMVDTKLTSELNYTNVVCAEWEGYLLCLFADTDKSKIYLADKRKKFVENGDTEYEWFYWELPIKEVEGTKYPINNIFVYRQQLFVSDRLGNIYKIDTSIEKDMIDENGVDIISYWTTGKDDFDAPSYTKTTNKKGCVFEFDTLFNNDNISITSIPDGVEKTEKIVNSQKGECVYKVKNKKFKKIQYKIESDKPFALRRITFQGFIAGYVKR